MHEIARVIHCWSKYYDDKRVESYPASRRNVSSTQLFYNKS